MPAEVTVGRDDDEFGASAAGVGDVNGDGHPDFLVGAPGDDTLCADSGTAWICLGGPPFDEAADLELRVAGPAMPPLPLAGDRFGDSVGGRQ